MNMKRLMFLLVVLLVCSAVSLYVLRRSTPDPIYQGQRLSVWLRGYETNYGSLQWIATDEAIRHFGTNAIPFLLEERCVSDSELKVRVSYWMHRHLKVRYAPAELRRQRARNGILALRPCAKEVVPVLMQLHENAVKRADRFPTIALSVIGEFGQLASSAVPFLIRETGSTNVYVRRGAFWALTQTHNDPKLVVPVFVVGLRDPDITVREKAAWGLEGCGRDAESALPVLRESLEHVESRKSEFQTNNYAQADYKSAVFALTHSLQWIKEASAPELVVPGLIDALHNSDYYGRMAAAEKLGKFGADAKEAILKLIEIRDEEEQMLKRVPNSIDRKRMYTAVTEALSKIDKNAER